MEPLRGRVQKVQKVQKVLPASSRRVQRVWYRLTAMSFRIPLRGMENLHNLASLDGNAPLFPYGDFS